MHEKNTPNQAHSGRRLEVTYTDKPVSGWDGLIAIKRFFDRLCINDLLKQCLPDGRTSPNRIPVIDIATALIVNILIGGERFAHVAKMRKDDVLQTMFGIKRMPSAMTLTRYFGGFVRSQVEYMGQILNKFTINRLGDSINGMTLDLDSTVLGRFGIQEGSLKGYNPHRHGRPSHHPLLAMLAEAKVVLNSWLRSGNTGSARGVCEFLSETLALLPNSIKLHAVRADSGFYIKEFLNFLENKQLSYAIVAKMNRHLQLEILHLKDWRKFGRGLDVADFQYKAIGWEKARRVIVIRKELNERPDARGRKLFYLPGYVFQAIVTTSILPAEEVWRFYNGRADCENRIKELKYDFNVDGFCLQSFDGTEAVFRLNCFLFNLLSDFKCNVLEKNKLPQLSTLRTNVFVIGAAIGADGRKSVLRLGLRNRRRQFFQHLLNTIDSLISTVAQFLNQLKSLEKQSRPWRLRARHSCQPDCLLSPGWLWAN